MDKQKRPIIIDVINNSPITRIITQTISKAKPEDHKTEAPIVGPAASADKKPKPPPLPEPKFPVDSKTEDEAKNEGMKEAIKETMKFEAENKQRLDGLVNRSGRVIHRIRNIIPILTGELVIDTSKVTVIHRPFFFSERIHSVSIQDLEDVYIETAPFVATINIIDRGFIDNVVSIRWFWKSKAEVARRIITGLMETSREGIDLSDIRDEDLAEKLEEIGKVHETKTSVSKA